MLPRVIREVGEILLNLPLEDTRRIQLFPGSSHSGPDSKRDEDADASVAETRDRSLRQAYNLRKRDLPTKKYAADLRPGPSSRQSPRVFLS